MVVLDALRAMPCQGPLGAMQMRIDTSCSYLKSGLALQELGADEVIDYTSTDFVQQLKGKPVDLVVDMVGGELFQLQGQPCIRPFFDGPAGSSAWVWCPARFASQGFCLWRPLLLDTADTFNHLLLL